MDGGCLDNCSTDWYAWQRTSVNVFLECAISPASSFSAIAIGSYPRSGEPQHTNAGTTRHAGTESKCWAMCLLAYRPSEVCGLRIADLRVLSVRCNRSTRTAVSRYSTKSSRSAPGSRRPADGSDYLFTSQKGGKLDRTQFFRVFQAVEKRHPHVLKHSLASHLPPKRTSRLELGPRIRILC
jgi:integrase